MGYIANPCGFSRPPLSHAPPIIHEKLMKENARQTQQLVRLALDTAFLVVGVLYGGRVLKRLPMTYLSEIAFPFDVRTTEACCSLIPLPDYCFGVDL